MLYAGDDYKTNSSKQPVSMVVSQDSSLKDLLNKKLSFLKFKTESYKCGELAMEAVYRKQPSLLILDPPIQNCMVNKFLNELRLVIPKSCRILFLSSPIVTSPELDAVSNPQRLQKRDQIQQPCSQGYGEQSPLDQNIFWLQEGCQKQLKNVKEYKNASILYKPFSMKFFEKEAKECLLSVR